MDEVIENKREFKISDIRNQIKEFIVEQKSTQHVQKEIDEGTEEDKHRIYVELLPHTVFVSNNQFGN